MASRSIRPLRSRGPRLLVDRLEPRLALAALPLSGVVAHPTYMLASGGGDSPVGLTPAQVAQAYAFNQIKLAGGHLADGSGQTIAIVDAFDDPGIAGDLAAFDQQFGLPAPASFSKVYASGSAPAANAGWSLETALDVEWAHAMAPGAGIMLVEAATAGVGDLTAAVDTARHLPGVTVVSMSWGSDEFAGETSDDGVFATPVGHQGITFVAASGDNAAPGLWPAMSPSVLATGGTSLVLANGDYGSETAWSKSGGGVSQFEPEPSYQSLVQTTGNRNSPDVAYDADPQTGFAIYNSASGSGKWQRVGGTSAAAPQWAALLGIADQGRAAADEAPLDGAQATLYKLPVTDFHDIAAGNNGYPATVGYDLATGLGSPIANLVVADLVGQGTAAKPASLTAGIGDGQSVTVGKAFGQPLVLTVLDQLGNPLPGATVSFAAPDAGASAAFPAGVTATTDNNGQVSEPVTANTVAGNYTVIASVAGIATPVSFSLTNLPDTPASIVPTTGAGQQVTVGGALQTLTAVVRDQFGNAVPGVTVSFAAPAIGAGASLGSATAVTNNKGEGSTSATADVVAGTYNVTATVVGVNSPAIFPLTNEPGAVASLSVTGGNWQEATIGAAFGQPLVVVVDDQFGNPVSGVTVTFAAPVVGASATLTGGGQTVTDHLGRATALASANNLAGRFSVVASVVGISTPADLSLKNDPAQTISSLTSLPSSDSSVFGQSISLTAIVSTAAPGLNLPTGSVTFVDGNTTLGTIGLTTIGGLDEATLTITDPISVGGHTIVAQYSSDANDLPSSQSLTETVEQDGTVLNVTTSAATVGLGQVVTLTATVVADAPGAGTPDGTVDFVDTTTGADLGSAALTSGVAQLAINNLLDGSHTIIARYSGDAGFLASSGSMTQDVVPLPKSSVAPLAGISRPTFVVAWSGSDEGGPGIAAYDIFVSDNGGDYQPWLTATKQTSAPFSGTLGHDYQFKSVAIDAMGDRQPMPATAQAWTAAVAKDANGEYVAAVYQQVLGRLPDRPGLDFWTAQLDSGTAISSVAATIMHSDEYFANEIVRPAYITYLGRPADDSGVAWWTARLQGGLTDEQLQANLAASDEFYARVGSNDSAWINAVFESLLNRPADVSAESYWTGRLAAGETRLHVASSLATSQEHEQAQIESDYLRYLHRSPDASGLAYWLSAFNEGHTDEDLIAAFVGSPEFYQQATS